MGIVMRRSLTRKQQSVYEYLVQYLKDNQRPPSLREIGERFDIKSPNGVLGHIRAREKKGWIRVDRRKSRGIVRLDDHNSCPCCGRPFPLTPEV
jgi:repressor LexA